MKITRRIKTTLLALVALVGVSLAPSTASAENAYQTLLPSLERTGAAGGVYTSSEQTNTYWRGARVFLNITAETGTATLNVKVQTKDLTSGVWFDVPGAALDEKSATTGDDILLVYPGVAETGNESVSDTMGRAWRVVATVGTGGSSSFTFSVGAHLLE